MDPEETCYRCLAPGPLNVAFERSGAETYVCEECLDAHFDETGNELDKPKFPFILRTTTDMGAFPPWPIPAWDGKDWVSLVARRTLHAEIFADSSGMGQEGEPALTQVQLKRRLQGLLTQHGDLALAIIEVGTFQLWIGVWSILPTEEVQ